MIRTRCLIIEDEPLAAEVISDYIAELPFLELVEVCHSATQGLAGLQENPVDLIFLDLHLPGIKGFDFIRTLRNPPQIIVTTAYHEYALEGYSLNIIDYLLKPIDFPRFLQAVNKVQKPVERTSQPTVPDEPTEEVILLKEGRNNVPVSVADITFIEGQRDYVLVNTPSQTVKTKSTLAAIQQRLSSGDFIRIHKSFIVARKAINSFSRTRLTVHETELPVGRKYAEIVQHKLQG
ncbi:MAG: response regulator transcription factor [Roseivirga sp.]|nr:response regulator transcription factor [Roseivirga sp.]